MVTGNEYVFENIDQALAYVLESERNALAADKYRQTASANDGGYDAFSGFRQGIYPATLL